MKVVVSGATGFVGSHLVDHLRRRWPVIGFGRRRSANVDSPVAYLDLVSADDSEIRSVLDGADTVVHLAARAHIVREVEPNPVQAFRLANVWLTGRLARLAAAAGVRRFIFLSSIGVHGSASRVSGGASVPIRESSAFAPYDAYTMTKLEGEHEVQSIARATGMDYVIIRPPLIYGPRVGGNFLRLLQLVRRRIPLPLGAARSPRSFVSVHTLCSLIDHCIDSRQASGQSFVVADEDVFSARQLIERIARAMGISVRLISIPPRLVRFAAASVGRSRDIDRLFEPLVVDFSHAKRVLNWSPPESSKHTLEDTVRWFLGKST